MKNATLLLTGFCLLSDMTGAGEITRIKIHVVIKLSFVEKRVCF